MAGYLKRQGYVCLSLDDLGHSESAEVMDEPIEFDDARAMQGAASSWKLVAYGRYPQ